MTKKVFVSGCFDLLHSGHVAFFEEAARYGDLYVALGSDRNIFALKNRATINNQAERLYMVKALVCVKDAFINTGSGLLDFITELKDIKPDYFIVNQDGHTPDKKTLCAELGIEYMVLNRDPHPGLTARSTTALRSFNTMPLGLVLAGNLFDRPAISGLHPGPVLTVSLYATQEFNPAAAHCSNTQLSAQEMWGLRLPFDRSEKLAKMLFAHSNLPGKEEFSGASEAIGIVCAGLTRAGYAGGYWPGQISAVHDEQVLEFLEYALHLLPLETQHDQARHTRQGQPENIMATPEKVKTLAESIETCWQALLSKDTAAFGRSLHSLNAAQESICPAALDVTAQDVMLNQGKKVLGWTIATVGNSRYLALVADQAVENSIRISIRREND